MKKKKLTYSYEEMKKRLSTVVDINEFRRLREILSKEAIKENEHLWGDGNKVGELILLSITRPMRVVEMYKEIPNGVIYAENVDLNVDPNKKLSELLKIKEELRKVMNK